MSLNRQHIGGTPAASFDESRLKLLGTNSEGLSALVDYLEHLVQIADEEFTKTARRAAFDPDVRMSAVHKQGIVSGIEMVRDKIITLRARGR